MGFSIIPASLAPKLHAVLRITTGLSFLHHGTAKIIHFPALPGLDQLPYPMLIGTGLLELVGGILIIIGLFTRVTAFVLSGFMAVAYFMIHVFVVGKGNIFPGANFGEAAYLYTFIFLFLASAGAGAWALDKD